MTTRLFSACVSYSVVYVCMWILLDLGTIPPASGFGKACACTAIFFSGINIGRISLAWQQEQK